MFELGGGLTISSHCHTRCVCVCMWALVLLSIELFLAKCPIKGDLHASAIAAAAVAAGGMRNWPFCDFSAKAHMMNVKFSRVCIRVSKLHRRGDDDGDFFSA